MINAWFPQFRIHYYNVMFSNVINGPVDQSVDTIISTELISKNAY